MTTASLKRRLDRLEEQSGANNQLLIIKAGDEVDKADVDTLVAEHDEGVSTVIIIRDFTEPLTPPTFIRKQEIAR